MPRLTARERREGYLREYSYQQRTGKQFFPYALMHDVVANAFFVFLIVGLTCLWYFTAKHGVDINHGGKSGVLGPLYENRADPAVESYDPRPEWYFFFLFELLRLFQNPELLLFATIIIPTLFMVVLIGMPFIDRSRERRLSRRPIAVGFAGAMAVLLLGLTWYGSKAPGAAVRARRRSRSRRTCRARPATSSRPRAAGTATSARTSTRQEAHLRARARPDHERQGRMPSFKSTFSAAEDQVHRGVRRDRVAGWQGRRQARRVAGDAGRPLQGHHLARRHARRAAEGPATSGLSPLCGDTAGMRFFVGITGASGAPYAARLLDGLRDSGAEIGVCASASAGEVIAYELFRDRAHCGEVVHVC